MFGKAAGGGDGGDVGRVKKVLLYINTIKYLKWIQIVYQIWNRIPDRRKERILKRIRAVNSIPQAEPVSVMIPALDLVKNYLARFQVSGLLKNEVEILHERHIVDLTKWEVTDASHLWNYNLHYLEFLIPLAASCREDNADRYYRKWCEYVESWIDHPVRDSFEPYTISVRIPNLLICMNLLQEKLQRSELERKLNRSIYQQYCYLLATQEFALLANHYFENLKTILICSVLFGEKDIYGKYFARFCGEMEEQILADGLHYERSLMYHKIILEDTLRVYAALDGGKEYRNDAGKLLPMIRHMSDALASVSRGIPTTPLFNDAGNNVAKDTDDLLEAVREVTGYSALNERTAFEKSGYYKLYAGENALLFDCGQTGPSYMGGHAHCDCLSFELTRGGKTVFANSGTYQYQGRLRQFFRSTVAHNTIMIDDREQAELWGEHRAARKLSGTVCEISGQTVSGRFRSFHGDDFGREIELTEKTLKITDHVLACDRKEHVARQFFHLHPDFCFITDTARRISVWDGRKRQAVIHIPPGSTGIIHREGDTCFFAQDFGKLERKEVLEIRTAFVKRVGVTVMIQLVQ